MRSDLSNRRRNERPGGVSRERGSDRFGMASESDARDVLAPGHPHAGHRDGIAILPLIQGGYYLLTGLWPHVHMESFERVTGRKTDRWLVRTVGSLAVAIGAGLVQAGLRNRYSSELRTVSRLAAIGFVAVEVPSVLRGRVPAIYLADAAVESGFVVAGLNENAAADSRWRELDRLAQEEVIID